MWVEKFPDLAEQSPEYLYITYVPSEERDKIMGMFIECWDALETSLHHVFRLLARTPFDVTNVLISSYNGTKQIADATYALAETILPAADLKALSEILERVRRIATKRNRIIHGHWVMGVEYESVEGPLGIVFRPTSDGYWERIYQPISPSERESLMMKTQQKIDDRYRFTLDVLMAVSERLLQIVDELSAFSVSTLSELPPQERP